MVAKELLVPNPLVYSDLQKYIWIDATHEEHADAQRLFDYMLKREIYIDGFATTAESLINLKMFHKKIVDISTLNNETSVVFYDPYFKSQDVDKEANGRHRARVLNSDFQGNNIVIWGAGITGECACKILYQNGIGVRYFVDSNKELEGMIKCGLPVYTPDKIEQPAEQITIIEALEKWKKLDETICNKYGERFYLSLENTLWDRIACIVNGVKKDIFCLQKFSMFNYFEDKKVYIYGNGDVERKFAKYLKLLDYNFHGFLIDGTESMKENDEYPVKPVKEIIHEDNYYIWVYDKNMAWQLNELGLCCVKDYIVNGYFHDTTIKRQDRLDMNLGHTYLAESKYEGIMIHGEEKEGDYKIAILGNSATDGALLSVKSWPEILYEELGKEGVTVYNAGVGGYTSAQELIHMIRDVLLLEPDMIIVYDSYTELNINTKYPFAFSSAKKVLYSGVESKKDYFDTWLSNIRSMYAIAHERGIRFFSFCQPWISSKKDKTIKEKNMLISQRAYWINLQVKESFREHIRERESLPEYIYDLSHIFDGKDVYIDDTGHVWETGNRIIAEEIKKIILPL